MKTNLAYFVSVLRKNFVNDCSRKLQQDHVTLGLWYPILYIGKHPDCSPKEVMQSLNMDWGFAQRTLDKLAADNLISREKNPEDRRRYHLNLTADGYRLLQKSHELINAWNEQKLAVLTPDEQLQLKNLLEKIVQVTGEEFHV